MVRVPYPEFYALIVCKINAKFNAEICKIYAKFNTKYVRSTLNSTQNYVRKLWWIFRLVNASCRWSYIILAKFLGPGNLILARICLQAESKLASVLQESCNIKTLDNCESRFIGTKSNKLRLFMLIKLKNIEKSYSWYLSFSLAIKMFQKYLLWG